METRFRGVYKDFTAGNSQQGNPYREEFPVEVSLRRNGSTSQTTHLPSSLGDTYNVDASNSVMPADGNLRVNINDGGNLDTFHNIHDGTAGEAVKQIRVDELKELTYGGDVKRELLALLQSYGIPEEYAGEVEGRVRGMIKQELRRRGLPEEERLVDALYRILIHTAYVMLSSADR
jgi:hypothetical protein